MSVGQFIAPAIEAPDTTLPVITPTVTRTQGASGWYTSDVSVSWTVSDLESDVTPTSGCESVSVTSDTNGTVVTCSATSGGGTSANTVTITRDATPPVINIVAPTGTSYLTNQSRAASFSCLDAGAGIASCLGTVADGAILPTMSAGSRTFVVHASDVPGNTSSATVNYGVTFNVCPLYDTGKARKSGSTIPIKLQLCDARGTNVSSVDTTATAVGVYLTSTQTPGNLDDSGNANPDFNFRFDPTLGLGGGYIFNLSLKGFGQGTYAMTFRASNDPVTHTIQFQVR